MKYNCVPFFILASMFSAYSLAATDHSDKKVAIIHSGDTRDCYFFKLEGVTEADPVASNNDWFAVPFDKPSAKNVIGILMAAKASNTAVTAKTTGQLACGGFAEVDSVLWL